MMKTFQIVLPVLFLLTAQHVSAQMRGWEVGGWVGGAHYFGDLNTDWRLNRIGLAAGATGRYNFNQRLAFRFGVGYGNISADDADAKNIFQQRRNLHFKTHIVDLGSVLEFNFLPYEHGHREFFFTPYVFAGPSVYFFNPKAELNGKWYALREFGTEGQFKGEEYNTTQGALSYGIGLKFDINYRWSIDMFINAHKLFTDYLDDVSQTYPDARDLDAQRGEIAVQLSDRSSEPKIGQAGRQRGNGKSDDNFVFWGIGATYYFGAIRCPRYTRD